MARGLSGVRPSYNVLKVTVTYRGCFLKALFLEILSSSLLAHHCFGVSSSGDNHSSISASSSDTAILHDILRVIFTTIKQESKLMTAIFNSINY